MKFIPFIMNEVNQIINFSAGNRSIMHMMPSSDLRNSTPQKEISVSKDVIGKHAIKGVSGKYYLQNLKKFNHVGQGHKHYHHIQSD